MTALALPDVVAERLAYWRDTLPPEAYELLAARLTAELDARRRKMAATLYDQDSPEALATMLGYSNPPHVRLLHSYTARAAAGEVVRVIVTLPARHGKTETLLKLGALWRLDRDPDCRVMQASGDKALVEGTSRWVRDELERPGTGYKHRPRTDVRAVDNWSLEGREGGIFVGSTSSRIIGRGANLLQVDDLLDRIQAESKVYRQKAWSFLQGALGRLEPNASVMVVMSRWSDDDPVARLLREQPGRWELVSIPAIAETHGIDPEDNAKCKCGDPWGGGHADPLGRAPGEPLWPERYDLKALEEKRLEIGAFMFAAQWQQRPMKRAGGLWQEDWITDRRAGLDDGTGRHPVPLDTAEQIVAALNSRAVAVDPSASDSAGGDEAGIVCGGRHPLTRDLWVTHDLSGHYTPEGWARTALVAALELEAAVVYERNLTPAFMRRTFKLAKEALVQEAAGAAALGLPAGTVASVLSTGRVLLPSLWPRLLPVSAMVGKELRAEPVAQVYEQRRVVHNGVFTLLEDQQLTWKPESGESPDRMDAVVHLITYLGDASTGVAVITTEPPPLPIATGASAASNPRYR